MERKSFRLNGFAILAVLSLVVLGIVGLVALAVLSGDDAPVGVAVAVVLLGLAAAVAASGFLLLNPNQAAVIQFAGKYIGTADQPGFHWVLPLSTRRKLSLRVRNFETARLKVADADGNPVEIAAVVVWRVSDTAKAVFGVDDYVMYVSVQAETAVRHLATSYPYEAHDSGRTSLRDGAAVSEELTAELRERVELAGVEVLESRITHLAYAPEIAQAMLARQQASAIVAARFKIVEGAVGMVQNALERLRDEGVIELDEERKAQMVANLLVVLCGDRAAQPVVNTGTLY
jgi:regulator of protease activity HflC (stomatin/prohibitin superfamily)